jgi:dephospho-CoA kinase
VSNLLSTRHNIPIIDADHLARIVVEPHTKAFHRIVTHFGPSVVAQTPSGPTLDRAALGARIFDNPAERAVLNSIVHPAVRKQMVWELMKCWARGERVVVVDVPLLIETGLWKWCGWVVVVYV